MIFNPHDQISLYWPAEYYAFQYLGNFPVLVDYIGTRD
jgi:hypothetical protein